MQAGSTYAVIAGAQVTVAGATAANAASLWILDSVDGVGQTRIVRAHNSADVTPIWWLRVVTPTEQMAPLDAADAAWHRQRHGGVGCLACLKLDSGDQSVTNDSVVTTLRPPIRMASRSRSRWGAARRGWCWPRPTSRRAAPTREIRLYDGTTAYGQGDSMFHALLAATTADGGADFTSAGSTTVKIRYASQDGAATTSVRTSALWPCCCRHPSFGTASDNTRPAPPAPASRRASPPPIPPLRPTIWSFPRPGPGLDGEPLGRNAPYGRRLAHARRGRHGAERWHRRRGMRPVRGGRWRVGGSRSWTLDWKSDGTNTGRMMSARLIAMALSA